jgi:hypothetical protein
MVIKGREGVGQGHSLASLSLASHKRGVGSSDGVCGELTGRRPSPPPHVMSRVQSRCCPGVMSETRGR